MNRIFLGVFFFTILLSNQVTNYWNLGIAIKSNKPEKRIVQRNVVLSNSTFYAQAKNLPKDIYTLKANYLIAPEKHSQSFLEDKKLTLSNSKTIKELIINEEYFEAAKQIITLEEEEIYIEFEDSDDYHYWSSFIYFNLGNESEAKKNIDQISNKDSNVHSLFLESLIIRKSKSTESDNLLKQIIKNFPNNEYSEYARSLLIDGK